MRKYILILLIIALGACSSNKDITGIYKSNFADLGFFITKLELRKDSTLRYNFDGDLIHQELNGKYTFKNDNLYLLFDKEKDSMREEELLAGNYNNYDMRNEDGISFHKKYLFKNYRLFVYGKENKLIKRSRYYSGRKRYLFFGPTWSKKKYYLKKKNI